MKFRVLGGFGGSVLGKGMTSFLLDDAVCLDAGGITGALPLGRQARVHDVLISHAHLDHTCSLPFLVDNNFSVPGFSLRVHAIRPVVQALQRHLFNGRLWPDFTRLPNESDPVLRLIELPEELPVRVGRLRVRAVRVSHSVPTSGFIVEDQAAALAFTSDTGPTRRFWELANATRKLRAVITEVSFPDQQQRLADVSGHLTPRTLALELTKLRRDVPVYLYGRKPRFAARIERQLERVPDERLRLLVQGRSYAV